MPAKGADRRLATVLFLDIVNSTSVASGLGDARWRSLLGRFRRIVREELKRQGGHEANFTGDGFLATFSEPAKGVRAAGAIADAVRELGVEVRTGLHTGEIETIDGHEGGMGVHVGARAMSVAEPGRVVVTSTVKELVTGAGLSFESAGSHELKGVPGTWQLYSLTAIDDVPLPDVLTPTEATTRLEAVHVDISGGRSRRWMVVIGGIIALAAIGAGVMAMAGNGGTEAPTITMIKIDPDSASIAKTIADEYYSHHTQASLWAQNGTIWQGTPTEVVGREPETGRVRGTLPLEGEVETGTFAQGFGWTVVAGNEEETSTLEKVDLVSGEVIKTAEVPGPVRSVASGDGSMWTVTEAGVLARIDPETMNDVTTWQTSATAAAVLVPEAGYVWICDCEHGRIVQFDPEEGREVQVLELPQKGFIVGVDSPNGDTLWVLDPSGSTLTPLDPKTGEAGQPIGVSGNPAQASIAFGAIWVAAGANVYRIDLDTLEQKAIPMPDPVYAGSITADEDAGVVWVANCGCPR